MSSGIQDEKKSSVGKVKKGFLVVQVGLLEKEGQNEDDQREELQRFVIPIWYLYHPLFIGLLDRAREVYGYHVDGPLRLPCSVDDFAHLRWRIEKENGGGSGGRYPHHHHILHQYFSHAPSFRSC
uniref:Uncharacterized protein n=1 Tax=Opuntia streptacantha TaxID=393608 RepID=A0A7C9DSL5_OPUST